MVSFLKNFRKIMLKIFKKIMRALWDLPTKYHSQTGPFPPKLDWIGCAI